MKLRKHPRKVRIGGRHALQRWSRTMEKPKRGPRVRWKQWSGTEPARERRERAEQFMTAWSTG